MILINTLALVSSLLAAILPQTGTGQGDDSGLLTGLLSFILQLILGNIF